jgi:two-component system phosphate regulon sensor histidine kinase PhoR
MKYISQKIFVSILVLLVLLSLSIIIFVSRTIAENYEHTFEQELLRVTAVSEGQIINLLEGNSYNELESKIVKYGKQSGIRFTVVDYNGIVIADSYAEKDTMENHINRPEIKEAFNNETGVGVAKRYSSTSQLDMLYYAKRLELKGTQTVVLRTSFFMTDVKTTTSRVTRQILIISMILVLIAIIITYVFSHSITQPIVSLTEASKEIASGDFDVRVKVKGKDELSNLATHFNEMTMKTQDLFERISKQKEDFRILVASMREGVLVISSDMVVGLVNESFNRILNADVRMNDDISRFIKGTELEGIVSDVFSTKKSKVTNVEIGEYQLVMSAVFMQNRDELIIVFNDITEIKKIESFKKDFIVNVSHELKTPLTAIKGFVETLEEEIEDEENSYYIEIINRHTDRLINIVQDLLTLSELEVDSLQLLRTKADIRQLIDNVLTIYQLKAKEKHISIMKNIPENPCVANVDAFRIEQVLVNLVDNAIKYTDEGLIRIDLSEQPDYVELRVSDTGRGMSEEDRKRVFERFYRADKSRTRKGSAGGTGLGMSIVKHIVLQHEGTIDVDSQEGRGTEFIIRLPKIN